MQAHGSGRSAVPVRGVHQYAESRAHPADEQTCRTPLDASARSAADRKIATILAADVVEYSRLMSADDEATLAALKVRHAIFDRLVREFDGREFGSVGDSLMSQFPSPVNALRCAQAVQEAIETENMHLPPDRRMSLRIGLNLGDVIEENSTLFGDDVNIAARLQALATPGGIVVSSAVHEQVKGKVPTTFRSIGLQRVKNISHPVVSYEVLPSTSAVSDLRTALSSIAVLPFANLTGEWAKECFGDGMAEELIHSLTRVPGLYVPARTSCFAFKGRNMDVRQIARELEVETVLEGSVRSAGERVRITAQLVDGRTGYHVWSYSFDRRFDDVLRLQHELAGVIIRRAVLRAMDGVPSMSKARD